MPSQASEQFLIEEFKQNCEYIRHVETIRLRHSTLLFAVVGALLTVLSIDETGITTQSVPIALTGVFITIYGVLLCAFIAAGKVRYDEYRRRNLQIAREFGGPAHRAPAGRTWQTQLASPFIYWYSMVALIAVGSSGFSSFAFGAETAGIIVTASLLGLLTGLILVAAIKWTDEHEGHLSEL